MIEDSTVYRADDLGARRKIVEDVKEYAARCTEEELRAVAPIICRTRLATFRALLLDAMVSKRAKFLQEIFSEISDPRAYGSGTMRSSVCAAIAGVAYMLDREMADSLLGAIMRMPDKPVYGYGNSGLAYKAELLSAFPRDALGPEHLAVLGGIQERLAPGTMREFANQEAEPGKIPGARFRVGRGQSDAFVLRALLDLLDGGADLEALFPIRGLGVNPAGQARLISETPSILSVLL